VTRPATTPGVDHDGDGGSWLRRYYLRTGPKMATAATTAAASIVSVLVTLVVAHVMLPAGSPMFWPVIAISVTIPVLVVPPMAGAIIYLINELGIARQTLEHMARTDLLTGVYNRRHFDDIGSREFERTVRLALPLTLLLLDMDDFKQINDRYGHLVGDTVLRAVAQACVENSRPYDVVARYGGEELIVLLPATTAEGALRLAERLRSTIAGLSIPTPGESHITPTASIGLASLDAATRSLEALFARADAAMYVAKRAGKNRVVAG
jgi:diguanylate cyclase (GGDEF)-like protein